MKRKLALVILTFIFTTLAFGSAAIFNGSAVKILKDELKFKSGSTITSDTTYSTFSDDLISSHLYGGTASSGNLVLSSTTNATKGNVQLGDGSYTLSYYPSGTNVNLASSANLVMRASYFQMVEDGNTILTGGFSGDGIQIGPGAVDASGVSLSVKGATSNTSEWALQAINSSSAKKFGVRNDGTSFFGDLDNDDTIAMYSTAGYPFVYLSSVTGGSWGYLSLDSGDDFNVYGQFDVDIIAGNTIDAELRFTVHGSELGRFTNVGSLNGFSVGANDPVASTVFDVNSTTQGSRPCPTMTTAQKGAISTPATGLCVYDSDNGQYEYYNGSAWLPMASSAAENIYEVLNAEKSSSMATDGWTETMTNDPTFAINSTTPLKGDKDYKITLNATGVSAGEYILSPAVAVPPRANEKDVANVSAIKFVCSYTGADDDLAFKMYDASNTSDIGGQVNVKNGTHSYLVEADLLSTSDSVKLKIEALTALSSAYVLICDSITFDDDYMSVKAIYNSSGWTSYTPTGDWASNTTYSGEWKRIGDSMMVRVEQYFSGQPSSGDTNFALPNSLTVDENKLNGTSDFFAVGYWYMNDTGTTSYGGIVYYRKSTDKFIAYEADGTGAITNASPITIASGDSISMFVTVPVTDWKDDADHVVRGDDRYQSHFVGSIEWAPTTGCTWNDNSAAWADFAADVDCDDNARIVQGEANEVATAGQLPQINFDALKAGHYTIVVTGGLYKGSSAGYLSLFRISDGTNNSSAVALYDSAAVHMSPTAVFSMDYASDQTNVTFKVQGNSANAANFASIYSSSDGGGLKIAVYYDPPPEEKVVPTLYALPTSKENTFSANIATDGTVSGEMADFINGNCTNAAPSVCSFNSNFFSAAPNCIVSSGTAGNFCGITGTTSTSSVSMACYTDAGAAATTSTAKKLVCQRGPSDYTPPGVFVGNVAKQRVMLIKDVKAANTSGGGCTSGAYNTRTLNTIEGDVFGSISSNQFTLPSGEYIIEASAPAYNVDQHKSQLYDITGAAIASYGSSEFTSSTYNGSTRSHLVHKAVLTASNTYEVRHRCSTTNGSNGYGVASNLTDSEVYTIVKITKLK